jgi:hypothetical protein
MALVHQIKKIFEVQLLGEAVLTGLKFNHTLLYLILELDP